jgi:phosphomevalonate kinase
MAEASAPGKLVVIGEYAVLHGASGIAIAVDVRARAGVSALTGTDSELTVTGEPQPWRFGWGTRGTPEWRETPASGQGRILEVVAGVLRERDLLPRRLPALRFTLDSGSFRIQPAGGTGEKLGLGSSAAVTVALTGALLQQFAAMAPAREQLLALCLEAHRRFQDGAGSGIDIAAAVMGGVVGVSTIAGEAVWRELPMLADLQWVALWTGAGASTTAMLTRFENFRTRHPGAFAHHMDDLRVVSEAALVAWDRADVPNVLRAAAEYDAALRRLDQEAGIGIYTAAHERLANLVRRLGAVYKPSGAGGGDFGLALSDSADVIDDISRAAQAEGILVVPLRTVAAGVELQPWQRRPPRS